MIAGRASPSPVVKMARRKVDGFEGYITSILLKDGTQLQCKIKKWATGDIKICINCTLVPEWLYNLECSHKLCRACSDANMPYICPVEGTKSKNYEAVPFMSQNTGLFTTIVECPLCGSDEKYYKLEEHVKMTHPQSLHNGMQLAKSENKLSTSPAMVGPPPGFERHISTIGRGRGLLHKTMNVGQSGYDENGYQHAPNDTELATSAVSRDDDMDIEQTPQLWPQAAGSENWQTVVDTSTSLPCYYCNVPVKSDERMGHLKHCLDAFIWWKQLIKLQVFHDCGKNAHDRQSASTASTAIFQGHITTCTLLEQDCKQSFVEVTCNYHQDHHIDQCFPSVAGSSIIEEHVGSCPKFYSKCRELASRVVQKYCEDHFSNRCPEIGQMTASLEGMIDQRCETVATPAPKAETKQGEEWFVCPNCSILLGIQDVANHTDTCPAPVMCEKCSSQVVAKEYGKHLADHCSGNKEVYTSPQLDGDRGLQSSTKPAVPVTKPQRDDEDAENETCPLCQTVWDRKDLQDHIEHCLFGIPSPGLDKSGQHPVGAFYPQKKQDSIWLTKGDEDNEIRKKSEDEVEALKNKVQELERRVKNLEQPLRRLIARLAKNE